ncbi:hypothetical protein TeGR_g4910, partial [Tetraparma gracilis]
YAKDKLGCSEKHPMYLVMHGGSGSTDSEIAEAVSHGVVKMNIDTDTQWAYWDGMRAFELENRAYLQGQIGNPKGADKPNKKFYDPRVWVRKAEESMRDRVVVSMAKLSSAGKFTPLQGKGVCEVGNTKRQAALCPKTAAALAAALAVGVAVGMKLK